MTAVSDLASLLRNTHITSDEDILRAANTTLKASKNDATALHARIVALLKLDRFNDALRVFAESGDALQEGAGLEYAYALYKTGELQKAEAIARKHGSGDGERARGARHVLAQTTYRLEKFDDAKQLYAQLSQPSTKSQNEESDLRINGAAVEAQLEWKGLGHLVGKRRPRREDLESFEGAYNEACKSIARGEMGKAEILLKRAKDLCSASEDLSAGEKKAEILPIIVQHVYVLMRLSRNDDARKLLEGIDISSISDPSTKHIAQVNSLGIASDEINPYTSHRLFHSSPSLRKNDRPFEYQQYILRQDEYAINLLALKYPGVARSTAAYLSAEENKPPTTSPSANTVSVLNAAAHARSDSGKAGLKAILPLLEQRPSDVGLVLTIVHLYLLTNSHGTAITLMEKFLSRLEQSTASSDADVRFAPGLVGTLVSLYALQGRKSHIRTELANAATFWREKRKSNASEVILHPSLLKAAGTALLESTDLDDAKNAASIFAELHAADPTDRYSAAGLVAALAVTDASRIPTSLLEGLTPTPPLVSGIDAAALEDAGVARPSHTLVVQPAVRKRAADGETTQRKRKKIRKSRMPKDFEEGKEMDPERWLPLRDRSYWRPKGKKGKKKAEGLTQGGFAEDKGPQQGQNQGSAGGGGGGSGGGGGGGGSAAKKKRKGKK